MLRLAQEMSSDTIIVDVAMPDLNGIEATRQIISRAPSIKALVLSMYSDRRYCSIAPYHLMYFMYSPN